MNATSDLYELEGELDGVCVVCREDCGSTLNAAGYCYSCNEKEKENENKSKCEVCGDQLQRVTYVRKMGWDDIEFEWQDEHQNIATCVIARPELRGRVYKVEPL